MQMPAENVENEVSCRTNTTWPLQISNPNEDWDFDSEHDLKHGVRSHSVRSTPFGKPR